MSEVEAVEAPVEDGSLSDHEAQFGNRSRGDAFPEPKEASQAAVSEPETEEAPTEGDAGRERDEQGRFIEKRHRAKSQQAKASDVPRIQELTKRLREAESERDRIRSEYEARQAQPQRVPSQEVSAFEPKPVKTAEFTEKEPKIEDFTQFEDPYLKLAVATAKWEVRKEQFEERERQKAEEQTASQDREIKEAETIYANSQREYGEKLTEFKKTHADWDELVEKSAHAKVSMTPLSQAVLLLHDNGPELAYYLLQHPETHAEMQLLTDGKAISEQSVAFATQWLERRAQAAQTGTVAAPSRKYSPPPPPIPVRTVPSGHPDSSDDENMSLSAHEAKYGRKRR